MGLLDFLRRGDGPSASQIQKAIKQVTQPHGDAAIRMGGAYRLRDWGTREAIAGLLRRFTVQTPSGQVDLEECQEFEQMLVDLGEASVEPILAFLGRESAVYYPARALQKILPVEQSVTRLLAVLEDLEAGFGSSNEQREGLLRALDSVDDQRIAPAVRRFLQDPSDDVVIAALACIIRSDDTQYRDDLVELLVSSGDRRRVQLEVAEKLAEAGWPLRELRKRLEGHLPSGFAIDKKGRILAV